MVFKICICNWCILYFLYFSCWIKNDIVFYITVVGYFCTIFLLNISMFIVVLIQLCRIKKKKQLGTQRKTSIQDLRSVAGLTFLLGITWGFAFFAWGPVNLIFMYLFAVFNTLQGMWFKYLTIDWHSLTVQKWIILSYFTILLYRSIK